MITQIATFYWARQAQDDPNASTYFVEVDDVAETLEEAQQMGAISRRRQLNVATAIGEGLTLEAIGDFVDTQLLARVAALEAERLDGAEQLE